MAHNKSPLFVYPFGRVFVLQTYRAMKRGNSIKAVIAVVMIVGWISLTSSAHASDAFEKVCTYAKTSCEKDIASAKSLEASVVIPVIHWFLPVHKSFVTRKLKADFNLQVSFRTVLAENQLHVTIYQNSERPCERSLNYIATEINSTDNTRVYQLAYFTSPWSYEIHNPYPTSHTLTVSGDEAILEFGEGFREGREWLSFGDTQCSLKLPDVVKFSRN